jgi:arsenate reductase (thioredoxin)
MVPARPVGRRIRRVPRMPVRRVLFVCIGNSCRSQMAEAFARHYGSDVLEAASAGMYPALMVAPLTGQVLKERNIGIEGHFPKDLSAVLHQPFDLVVNMSGLPLEVPGADRIEWMVRDPIGQPEEVFRSVADQIESMVMRLILNLRSGFNSPNSGA